MSFNALAIANHFLDLAKSKGYPLSPMKLQKLIYFAHGWNLAIRNKPLINEQIQALDYGPVVSSVYHEFKKFGGGSIDALGTDFDMGTQELYTPRVPLEEKETIALLNKIWEVYGKFTGVQLSNLTHAEGSAWSVARNNNEDLRSVGIDNQDIKRDFLAKKAA